MLHLRQKKLSLIKITLVFLGYLLGLITIFPKTFYYYKQEYFIIYLFIYTIIFLFSRKMFFIYDGYKKFYAILVFCISIGLMPYEIMLPILWELINGSASESSVFMNALPFPFSVIADVLFYPLILMCFVSPLSFLNLSAFKEGKASS